MTLRSKRQQFWTIMIWMLRSSRSAAWRVVHPCRRVRNIPCGKAFRPATCLTPPRQHFFSTALALNNEDEETFLKLTAPFPPTGDQPQAIAALQQQLEAGNRFTVLKGITGTGKTLVMAHLIAQQKKPTLVLCHNKTLAAQLARELGSFFKGSAVHLFISYYNHYVPESYVESTGKYIAKKSSINAEIDILRHRATRALLMKPDVVVVSTVSCIYGLGLPKEYLDASFSVALDDKLTQNVLIDALDKLLYEQVIDDRDFQRGTYQSFVDDSKLRVVVWPPHEKFPMQLEFIIEDQDRLSVVGIRQGTKKGWTNLSFTALFPAKHHVVSSERLEMACLGIEDEMRERTRELFAEGNEKEGLRLQQRVLRDLQMLRETGFCSGGENYSRHFAGRQPGDAPDTLLDYMSVHDNDWLLIVDESHVTLPQLGAMYIGDQSRKRKLVKHGYRLPSALDNRPLKEEEFWKQVKRAVFVSATPGRKELEIAGSEPVEMIIRPTYVCDPEIEIRSSTDQLEDLVHEITARSRENEKSLALALTKRDAQDLASFLEKKGIRSGYIHSDLNTQERSNALKALQTGEIDCLVGVNLLREGLDLPQVSLVAILNADAEGFLRSETSLLQTVGRAARNMNGKAIFYANRVTKSMEKCIEATSSRRQKQLQYNLINNCQVRSTKGSTTQSIFELLKDEIEDETSSVTTSGATANGSSKRSSHLDAFSSATAINVKPHEKRFQTDHIPCLPGVYFWKDELGTILYIGKAANLRTRVKSYLAPGATLSKRIEVMLQKADSLEFVLTPSERDALVLESHSIKIHQPPFNVLLKDDEHYPYICASVGDSHPRLFVARDRDYESPSKKNYKYFGPYTSFKEITSILSGIEERYGLGDLSFRARYGSAPNDEYLALFGRVLDEVFSPSTASKDAAVFHQMRQRYEEAGLLFDSKFNSCRDVVVAQSCPHEPTRAVVKVYQLRSGIVAGQFSYAVQAAFSTNNDGFLADAIQTVLERRHYPSGSSGGQFSWFPDDILLSHSVPDMKDLKASIRRQRSLIDSSCKVATKITMAATRGQRKLVDARVMAFAFQNINNAIIPDYNDEELFEGETLDRVVASEELASMLHLTTPPSRIECYDISHTQGDFPVGSRVVFLDGKPAPHLYRSFNIRTVEGVDDYASLAELLERRFRHAKLNGSLVDESDPWAIPDLVVIDGGPGQLNAALKGMSTAGIYTQDNQGNEMYVDSHYTVAVCALAKNKEEVFVVGKMSPVNTAPDSPGVLLLRAIRDESHRFALFAHRRRRSLSKHVPRQQKKNNLDSQEVDAMYELVEQ